MKTLKETLAGVIGSAALVAGPAVGADASTLYSVNDVSEIMTPADEILKCPPNLRPPLRYCMIDGKESPFENMPTIATVNSNNNPVAIDVPVGRFVYVRPTQHRTTFRPIIVAGRAREDAATGSARFVPHRYSRPDNHMNRGVQ